MRIGSVHSAESKAKISESMKGNHNNPSDKNNGVGMNSDEPSPSVPVRIVKNH